MPKLERAITGTDTYSPSPQAIQAADELWMSTLKDLEAGELYLFFGGTRPCYLGLLLSYSEVWAPPPCYGSYEIASELKMLVGERTIGLCSVFFSDRQFINEWSFKKLTEELMEELSKDPDFEW